MKSRTKLTTTSTLPGIPMSTAVQAPDGVGDDLAGDERKESQYAQELLAAAAASIPDRLAVRARFEGPSAKNQLLH